MGILMAAARDNGSAVVVVTHDPNVASFCGRTVMMQDGRLHQTDANPNSAPAGGGCQPQADWGWPEGAEPPSARYARQLQPAGAKPPQEARDEHVRPLAAVSPPRLARQRRPHLDAGNHRLRRSHHHLPHRARRRTRFHLAGFGRSYRRLRVRLRCLRPDTVAAWKRQISDPTSLAQFSTAYVALAVFACMLLVVPFVALAGSAARLAASRRDARLAALRLAGATTGQVVRLTALDAAGQALIGALIGIAGYCA